MAGMAFAGVVVMPNMERAARVFCADEVVEIESLFGKELEQRLPATTVPVLSYRYPGFSKSGIELPEDLFLAQMNFLKEGGFKTLSNYEMESFLENKVAVPVKSVTLRVNQGASHFAEFETMIDEFKSKGFVATVVLDNSSGSFTQEMQAKLGKWVSEGTISIGTETSFSKATAIVCPFVQSSTLETISVNTSNNPRSINLQYGYPIDRLVFENLTPVTVEMIKELTGEQSYEECRFAECVYLPIYKEQSEHLTKPEGIIIHTDAQNGNNWEYWNTNLTYETLLSRKLDVTFAVGRNGVNQYLKMYKDVATPNRGALGFRSYISIEMCGRDYDDVFNPSIDSGKKMAIEEITTKTIDLVLQLMETYGIGLNTILGHYAASASGKIDPGKRYMEEYFMPKLRVARLKREI